MPPKKNAKSEKTKTKEKQKIIEDKTFGLKNKNKSAKVNRYVQQVQQQVMSAGNRKDKKQAEERKQEQLTKKQLQEQKKAELAELFKPIQVQKVPFGVDPKTVLCQFHKMGQCQKGDKCKFSHDLNIHRKTTKIDLYTDKRDDDKATDTMDNWDQSKLEEVVHSKHGNPQTTTDIVCKYFLDAIENQKYGWFWECPNGGKQCKYRHALPPGFVFKSKKDEKKEDKEEISLEEFLEVERHKLGENLTPVTFETFKAWKQKRIELHKLEQEKLAKQKESQFKSGKFLNFTGRDLFHFNPELLNQSYEDEDDEDNVFDFNMYQRTSDNEEDNSSSSQENASSPPIDQFNSLNISAQS